MCNSFSGLTKPVSISTIICNGNCKETSNSSYPTFIKYTDAYLTMAHEMAHVLGANHTISGIMAGGENKASKFESVNKDQIINYYCDKTCVNSNNITTTYTNRFKLTLNGNPMNSTPVFINKNTKVVTIPPDSYNSYIPLVSSNFSYSNPNVFVFYKTLDKTSFALGSVNSFTLNVSAFDGCLNYYWGIPFTYSAAGARLGDNLYPVPADETLNIAIDNEENIEIDRIQVFDEKTNLRLEIEPNTTDSKYQLNTSTLKTGVYYVHIIYKNGEVSKKES